MNKMLYVGISAAVMAGCATTSQVEEANARILDLEKANAKIVELEKKIARIEGDLYRVEVKSAPKQAAEPKFVPAKEVEQSVIDTKIDAFLKEYLGVAFGDPIDKYPQMIEGRDWLKDRYRVITVQKKFQYFDKALAHFNDGKLCGVSFFADIDNKYSIDSTNERINQTLADLAVTFGIASNTFERRNNRMLSRRRMQEGEAVSSYSLSKCNSELAPKGFRRYGAVIVNSALSKQLDDEKRARERAAGEKLPEAK